MHINRALEAMRGIKLKHSRIMHNIGYYKKKQKQKKKNKKKNKKQKKTTCSFVAIMLPCCNDYGNFVSIDADILTKVLEKRSSSSHLPNICFFWIGWHIYHMIFCTF